MKFYVLFAAALLSVLVCAGCDSGVDIQGNLYEKAEGDVAAYLQKVDDDHEAPKGLTPLKGAKVELIMPEEYAKDDATKNPWASQETDEAGSFRLKCDVPSAEYKFKVRITKDGYEPVEIELDYMKDKKAELEGLLKKK